MARGRPARSPAPLTPRSQRQSLDAAAPLPAAFRKQYAWVVNQLEQSSEQLERTLVELRRRSAESLLRPTASSVKVLKGGDATQLLRQRAAQLVRRLQRGRRLGEGDARGEGGEAAESERLVTASVALAMMIQVSAQQGHPGGDVRAALEQLRPRAQGNLAMFNTVCDLTAQLLAL